MKKAIGITLAWVMAQFASAQVSLPYSIAFETNVAAGETILTNANCGAWEGGPEDVEAYVTNISYPKPRCDYPLPSESHDYVLAFANGTISNSFSADGITDLWIDTMIQPKQRDEVPSGDVTNSQMALYFDTNGYMNVYHGVSLNGYYNMNPDYAQWSLLSNSLGATGPGQWVRVSIQMKHVKLNQAEEEVYQSFFAVSLNGIPFSNENAYVTADVKDSKNGSWFLFANFNGQKLNSMALTGGGMLDDLVVSTDTPVFSEAAPFIKVHIAGQGYVLFDGTYTTNNQVLSLPSQGVTTNFYMAATNYHYIGSVWTGEYGSVTGQVTIAEEKPSAYDFAWSNIVYDSDLFVSFAPHLATNGTPLYWMNGKGLGTNGIEWLTWDDVALDDQDKDGMFTWQEYVARTDPNNSNSVLRILAQTFSNGAPSLIWRTSTEVGAPSYMIQMSTNLISGAWSNVAVNISASGTGTNVQQVTAPASGQGMYKVTITN